MFGLSRKSQPPATPTFTALGTALYQSLLTDVARWNRHHRDHDAVYLISDSFNVAIIIECYGFRPTTRPARVVRRADSSSHYRAGTRIDFLTEDDCARIRDAGSALFVAIEADAKRRADAEIERAVVGAPRARNFTDSAYALAWSILTENVEAARQAADEVFEHCRSKESGP